jgi:hypothetical protein
MPEPDDITLLKQYAGGDESAFAALFERYVNLVYSPAPVAGNVRAMGSSTLVNGAALARCRRYEPKFRRYKNGFAVLVCVRINRGGSSLNWFKVFSYHPWHDA